MKEPTLFSDFLEALKVPHTLAYSSKAYRTYELLEHANQLRPYSPQCICSDISSLATACSAAYVAALLGLNRLMPLIEKTNSDIEDETLGTP